MQTSDKHQKTYFVTIFLISTALLLSKKLRINLQ